MQTNNDITFFARTNYRDKQVPFGIKRDDRRKHMYLVGKTGMGKTSMIENMIVQDIINGNGLCFIDPHGDSVEKILNYIPSYRSNDVIYFNPADMDFPIAFNIFEAVDPRYKHLVASGLMGVFTKIWAGVWSSRMEHILNNCILALLDSPGNTLLGISRILVDKKYRKKIVDNVKDPIVKGFWIDEFANWQEKYRSEAIAPIQNKVGQFLSSSIIRNIVGQSKSTLDLRDAMDSKKIILMNLSKGRVGEENSALLGAMVVTKLQLAALSRVDMVEEDRPDFYLFVDEFQNFVNDSFATILSEARKYRLNLIVAHQYIGQLVQDRNVKVRDAVFGNVGTMISFRVGAEDAEFLEKEFAPQFAAADLVNLPKYTVLLKLMINGVASAPFTGQTLEPGTFVPTNNGEKVIRISRERYSNPVKEVEEKILRWMGQEFHEEAAAIASNSTRGDEDEIHVEQTTIPVINNIVNVPAQAPAPEPVRMQQAEALHVETPVTKVEPQEQVAEQFTSEEEIKAPEIPQLEPSSVESAPPVAEAEVMEPIQKVEKPIEHLPAQKHHDNSERRAGSDRRDYERRDSHNDHHDQHGPSNKPKDKPKFPKKETSAIWEQASKINSQKSGEDKKRTEDLINMIDQSLNAIKKARDVAKQQVPEVPVQTQSPSAVPVQSSDLSPEIGPEIPSDPNEPIVKIIPVERPHGKDGSPVVLAPNQPIKFDE
jgi:hypothetical protein